MLLCQNCHFFSPNKRNSCHDFMCCDRRRIKAVLNCFLTQWTQSIHTLAFLNTIISSNAWKMCVSANIYIETWMDRRCVRLTHTHYSCLERQKYNSCDKRVLANFHAIGNGYFTCQHHYLIVWTRPFILPISSPDWATMAEPDALISIAQLAITLLTGASLAVGISSLEFFWGDEVLGMNWPSVM